MEHCARHYDQKHGLLAAHPRASWRTRRSHDVLLVSELQQSPLGRLHLVGLWRKRAQTNGGARSVERNTIGSNQTSFWSDNQVKVSIRPRSSKHMQYLRGLCANLINASKLPANQQEDGDGLIQNIVDKPR